MKACANTVRPSAVAILRFRLILPEPLPILSIYAGTFCTIGPLCLWKALPGTFWFIRHANIFRTTIDAASTRRDRRSAATTPPTSVSTTIRSLTSSISRRQNKSQSMRMLDSTNPRRFVPESQMVCRFFRKPPHVKNSNQASYVQPDYSPNPARFSRLST